MKIPLKYLVFISFLHSSFCTAQELNIGIYSNSLNEICVAFEKSSPKLGDVVSLVSTNPNDSPVIAKIGVAIASCKRLENSSISGPYFKVEVAKGTEVQPFGFAILGGGNLTKENEVIAWRGDGAEKPVYLRSCASSEGVHLTAWATPNIVNHSQWHQYISLGYDLEPNCNESEVE